MARILISGWFQFHWKPEEDADMRCWTIGKLFARYAFLRIFAKQL